MTRVYLGSAPLCAALALLLVVRGAHGASCCAGDVNGDQVVTIDEILRAVDAALNGCAAELVPCQCGGNTCAPPSVDVTGNWSGTWRSKNGVDGGTISFVSLTQNGAAVGGQGSFGGSPCFSVGDVSGSVCGDTFGGSLGAGGIEVDFAATVIGNQIDGTYNAVSAGSCTGDTGTFSGRGSVSPFVDNGDGTITDKNTGLMWEKKDNAGGIHDLHNSYTWSSSGSFADGTAFTVFLATLNTPPCFAGHCDWRLPSEDGQNSPYTGAKELEDILAAPYLSCAAFPCVPPVFNTNCGPNSDGNAGCTVDGAGSTQECSCTANDAPYWSSTTYQNDVNSAWYVYFNDGHVSKYPKSTVLFRFGVRAVRGGL